MESKQLSLRMSSWLYSHLSSKAQKHGTSVAAEIRNLIEDDADYTNRFEELREQNDRLSKSVEILTSEQLTFMHNQWVAESRFDTCVVNLVALLQGKLTEDQKKELLEYYTPHAMLAVRRIKEKDDLNQESRERVAKLKKSLDEDSS